MGRAEYRTWESRDRQHSEHRCGDASEFRAAGARRQGRHPLRRATGRHHDQHRAAAEIDAPGASNQLYLGFAVWEGGATTEGFEIADADVTFNAYLLNGGMPTASSGTGRAVYNGPRTVVYDACAEQMAHQPSSNPGTAPVAAIVFGTAVDGGPVSVESAA